MTNTLYKCPYNKITTCDLKEPCLYCETFGRHLEENRKKILNIND